MSKINEEIKERIIKKIQVVIKQYDGIFDPTKDKDSLMMAEHIFKVLRNYGYLFNKVGEK